MGCAAGLTPGLVMASDLAPPVQESLSFKIFWQGSDIGRHVQTIVPMDGNGSFTVEANDLGAVRLLMDAGVPFVTGPTVNIYNTATLSLLAHLAMFFNIGWNPVAPCR